MALLTFSCSTTDWAWDDNNFPGGGQGGPGGNQGGPGGNASSSIGSTISFAGLTDFDVAFNTDNLSEKETIPTGDEDYYENAVNNGDFSGTVTITYNGTSDATVDGKVSGSVTVEGGNVVVNAEKAYQYILKGSSDNGRFKLYSSKKAAIILDNVSLTNPTGAAINIQSKKRMFLVLADGSENTLKDGTTYETEYDPSDATSAEKQKGTYYSKGQTIISGNGKLNITASYKHGIDTKDYLRIRPNTNIYIDANAGNCIKCENSEEGEGLIIEGGVLNLNNSATAGKGLSSDGQITINGGRITIITSGDGEWDGDDAEIKDVSGAAGIKCDLAYTQNGGDIWIKSTGKGGKGINGDTALTFNGGTTHVITTGQPFQYTYNSKTYDTNPKGIKTDTDIYVNGGEIYVRTTGTKEGSEGIEAKQKYSQSGGSVMIYAADDALNTGYSSDSIRDKQNLGYDVSGLKANAGIIQISGGYFMSVSSNNDGMDSNGTISISGGTVEVYGSSVPETSFDCDQNEFSITGGTLIGFAGSAPSTPTESKCSQVIAILSANATEGSTVEVKDSKGTTIISAKAPRSYTNGAVLISSPKMEKGGTYKIGDASITCSTSSYLTSSVSSGFGGPGGR